MRYTYADGIVEFGGDSALTGKERMKQTHHPRGKGDRHRCSIGWFERSHFVL